jgi:hypothetical protein
MTAREILKLMIELEYEILLTFNQNVLITICYPVGWVQPAARLVLSPPRGRELERGEFVIEGNEAI